MSDKVIRWTSFYLKEGLNPIEARKKAIDKVSFEKEVENIDTRLNKPIKGL